MQHIEAHNKMLDRRRSFVARYPFFGTHAMRLELVEDITQPTGYTDGKVLGYNPHFVMQLTGPQIDMLFAHEVMHVVLNHPWRRGIRDPKCWNIAGDHVINLILVEEKFSLIPNVLCNPDFAGRSTEWVYGQVYREQNKPDDGDQPSGNDGDPSDDQGDDQDSGQPSDQDGEPSDDQSDDQGDDQDGDQPSDQGGDQDGDPGDQPGDPGGNQGGDQEDDQPGNSSSTPTEYGPDDVPTFEEAMESSNMGNVRDCLDDDGQIDTQAEIDNNQAVTITSSMERKRGEMSGPLMEQINGRLESVVEWRESLLTLLQNFGNDFDVTWSKPNRRFIGGGDYFPTVKREGLEHVVLVVDSSYSMSVREIRQAVSETLQIVEEFECKVTFMSCAKELGPVQTWEHGEYPTDASEVVIGARGGTLFTPPFEYVEDMDDQPDAMIYFTDGEAPFPDEPDMPVVWATVPDFTGWCVTPPFGHQIEVQFD